MANLFHLSLTTATISLILLFLSPLTTANSPVVDTQGNPLQPGSRYYVLTSGSRGASRGGLAAGPIRPGRICPEYVFQYSKWPQNGIPVTVTPSNSSEKEIRIGMDVNFSFGPNPICWNFAGVWKLTSSFGVTLVSTDGTRGDPNSSFEAFLSTFEIREVSGPGSYKIVYCFARIHVNPGPPECQQLDATVPRGLLGSFLSLAPIDKPLPFVGFKFQKVDEGGSTY